MTAFDYEHANQIVTKILEAAPDDSEANLAYDRLQNQAFESPRTFEIRNAVLIKYYGRSDVINIPAGIERIAAGAFEQQDFITKVIIPDGVISIGKHAFRGCCIKEISLPKSLRSIDEEAFDRKHCTKFTWR